MTSLSLELLLLFIQVSIFLIDLRCFAFRPNDSLSWIIIHLVALCLLFFFQNIIIFISASLLANPIASG